MMKPVIGLNCNLAQDNNRHLLRLWRHYATAVELAGGVPILLPLTDNPTHIDEQLDIVDGLVLTGGADYDPKLYGAREHSKTKLLPPERQTYDLELARAAIRRQIPILGICGGHQLINILCGGNLIQHLPDEIGDKEKHDAEIFELIHEVSIEPNSMLARIIGADRLAVNSTHHQAVGKVGSGLHVSARSPHGVIEAMESKIERFLLCVQWHPERLAAEHLHHRALFEALIEASSEETGRA